MGLRYRKRIKVAPGVHLNLSKSGVSTSVGKPGATVNFSGRGTKVTTGIPGTGISYSTMTKKRGRPTNAERAARAYADIQSRYGLTDWEMKWLMKQMRRHPKRFRNITEAQAEALIQRHRNRSPKKIFITCIKIYLILVAIALIVSFLQSLK